VKVLKIVAAVLGIGLVALIIVVWVLVAKLDSLVARAIENGGSRVTGTEVTVSGVDIGIEEGSGTVSGLSVANPDAFSNRPAFHLGEITLDIDVNTIQGDGAVVVEVIRIQAPEVLLETIADGSTNLDVIRRHVQSVADQAKSRGGDPGAGSGDDSRPLLLKRIEFSDGIVRGDATALGIEPFEVRLPAFEISDVGAPNGVPPAEIGSTILVALSRKAAEAVAREQGGKLLKEKLGEIVGEKGADVLDALGR
jgi:hypothetical protein